MLWHKQSHNSNIIKLKTLEALGTKLFITQNANVGFPFSNGIHYFCHLEHNCFCKCKCIMKLHIMLLFLFITIWCLLSVDHGASHHQESFDIHTFIQHAPLMQTTNEGHLLFVSKVFCVGYFCMLDFSFFVNIQAQASVQQYYKVCCMNSLQTNNFQKLSGQTGENVCLTNGE